MIDRPRQVTAAYTRHPAEELEQLRGWAADSFPGTDVRNYIDPAESPRFDAPSLVRLLTDIDAGTVQQVVSYEFDLLTRDFPDLLRWMRLLMLKRVQVLVPGGGTELVSDRLAPLRDLLARGGGAPPENVNARKWTPEQAEQIRRLRTAGVRPDEIGKQVGLSRATVYRLLKRGEESDQ